MKRSGPMNYQVQKLLINLKEESKNSKFWKKVMKDLQKPSRQQKAVNIYKIEQFARDGETILVPGKVLSVGEISKKVDVAAKHFSTEAKRKIIAANGRTLSIQELWQQNPAGKKVRILG